MVSEFFYFFFCIDSLSIFQVYPSAHIIYFNRTYNNKMFIVSSGIVRAGTPPQYFNILYYVLYVILNVQLHLRASTTGRFEKSYSKKTKHSVLFFSIVLPFVHRLLLIYWDYPTERKWPLTIINMSVLILFIFFFFPRPLYHYVRI